MAAPIALFLTPSEKIPLAFSVLQEARMSGDGHIYGDVPRVGAEYEKLEDLNGLGSRSKL